MAVITNPNLIIDEISEYKPKPADDELSFGHSFTDRMLVRDYADGSWKTGRIMQYKNFSLPPSTMVFHYAQEIFEGLKAFRQVNGDIVMFRPDQNGARFNRSAERMVMPKLEDGYFVESISKLIDLERDWVPGKRGTALYIRPTMIATEPALGVHPSNAFKFFTILSPSGPYFAEGFKPTKIKVENHFVRAPIGGTGEAKAGGNYAGSLYAAVEAKKEGFSQVLWLDAKTHSNVEEVGAMNIAFVIDDEVLTPKLSGSILDGITRKSVIQLANDLGIPLHEKTIPISMIIDSIKSGSLTEIFGIGTAASIAPVGELKYEDQVYTINNNQIGPITQKLYDQLLGIQYGSIEDSHGWIHVIDDN